MADDALSRWLRPRVVFPVLGLLLVLMVVLTPQPEMGVAEPRLTTHSVAPNGARGLYEVVRRLGWRVERRLAPFRAPLDSTAVYALLAPPIDPTASETSALLDAVRRGAGLIVIPREERALADSLNIQTSAYRYVAYPTSPDELEDEPDAASLAGPHQDVYSGEVHHVIIARAPLAPDTVVFLRALYERASGGDTSRAVRAVVVGIPYGRGRILAVAEPRLLRNDTMRQPDHGLLPVRALEWVSPRPGATIVFAEFHHGFGRQGAVSSTLARALFLTAPGRALLGLLAAGLVLLAALGARPLPPKPAARIERRSPLEHVGALARAYEQVGATRTAARRLVRGLRRRHLGGPRRGMTDEDYLHALATREPAISADVERVLAATRQPVPAEELLAVGRAIASIERTIVT
jgi:hypothetical protein